MNSLQQKAILQIWAAARPAEEIARSSSNLSSSDRNFVLEALRFHRSPQPLSGKRFENLIKGLNGAPQQLTLIDKVKKTLRTILGINTDIKVASKFKSGGRDSLDRVITNIENRIYEVLDKEETPETLEANISLSLLKTLSTIADDIMRINTAKNIGEHKKHASNLLNDTTQNLTEIVYAIQLAANEDEVAKLESQKQALIKTYAAYNLFQEALPAIPPAA